MKCSRCQHENPSSLKFCGECGTRLAAVCASCGAANAPEQKFCGECGSNLNVDTAKAKIASPDSYTPKHLAEKILTSRAALEGERKQVTVLFADLKGSMELLADRDPEEARKLLEPVLNKMIEAVHQYEGMVNQVMGDGIMALFGAPIAHEDHAVRACYAALRMQDSVRQYAQQVFAAHGVQVEIRVGLNSGEVVVGAIGSDLRMEYTAVGQTTHLAARMEQMALPGTALMSASTLALAEGYVAVKPRGRVPIKGLTEPVDVFELIGAGQARTRLQATALRGLTRFVGRDAEVEHLRRVLDQAGSGHGQVVAIVGEAGVGKSRLTHEFTHSHRVQDWLIVEASSVSYGKATSYLPVIDLLKGYFKIGDRDDYREMRDKVLGRALGLDRTLEPLLTPLLSLLDIPVEDAAWQHLDPAQRRQRTLDAVKRLLLREAKVQPLLVVFEDLHWIDSETQVLLDNLVESLGAERLLLLVNYRPEYEHRWGNKTAYSQLRLDSLPAESAHELLAALLGSDEKLAPLTQMLVKRGNPFFLEESVRTLVETGALVGERGAYRLARKVELLQVPATVQSILEARIDRLPPEEKQLLQAASVIGKHVPYALLAVIADQSEETLRKGLAHLQVTEFLYEANLFPDLEYTFKHALTHEVTYGNVLRERRKALHARIVAVIEHRYPDRLAEYTERLGDHAFRGELWDTAVGYLREAGVKALARSANREAATWFDQALLASEHVVKSDDTVKQAIDIRFDLRNALYPLAEFGRLLALLREAESLCERLGDQVRLARVSSYLTHYFWVAGQHEHAVEIAERSLSSANNAGSAATEIVASTWALGQAYHALGEYRSAVDFFERMIADFEGDLVGSRFGSHGLPLIFSRSWLARALSEIGRFDTGITYSEEAVRLAEVLDHPFSLTVACWGVGYVHIRSGRARDAIVALERAVELCKDWSFLVGTPTSQALLGYAYALSGRVPEGLPLLKGAVEQSSAMQVLFSHSLESAWLSEAYLLAGSLDDALKLAEHALRVASERKERGCQAWILRLHGEIVASLNHVENRKAPIFYKKAIALATELGMRPLVGHCHVGLAKSHAKIGQREEAKDHLATATTVYRETDMQFWLDQTQVEMKELT